MKVSFIVTSIKSEIETSKHFESCPFEYEVLISKSRGIARARNRGAMMSKNDLIVFFDDDLRLNPRIWKVLPKVKKGSFVMAYGGDAHGGLGEPITRFLAIHMRDFLRVGGFNDDILLSGEDREFFMNSIRKGLLPRYLPQGLIVHKEHKIRFGRNRAFDQRMMFEHAKVLATHGAYTRFYKGFLRWFFPYLFKREKTVRLYGAKIFWSSIRDLIALVLILTGQRYSKE